MPITNSFELKVVTDPDGKNVSLDDMPVETAKVFLTFYQAMVTLAELSGDDNPRVGIKSGSAVAIATGKTAELIEENYQLVVDGNCIDPNIVKQWREVQAQLSTQQELVYVTLKSENLIFHIFPNCAKQRFMA